MPVSPEVDAVMDVQMRQVQVERSGEERKQAQAETHQEADEVEVRPGHGYSLTGAPLGSALRSPLARMGRAGFAGTAGVRNTSMRRSAKPGFSRISPRRRTHMRESLCLATVRS